MHCAQCGEHLHVVTVWQWRGEAIRRRRCPGGHIQWTRETPVPRPPAAFVVEDNARTKALRRART